MHRRALNEGPVPEARNRHRAMPTRSDPDVGHQAAGPPQSVAEPRADRNRLLRALPDEEYDLLLPHMERLEVPLLAVLNAPSTSCSPRRCCRRCSAFAAPA